MKLLVDANLSPRVVSRLRETGCDADHVRDHDLVNADDEAILRHAVLIDSTVVSADSDFATLLALGGLKSPSLILLRSADHLTPDRQADLLITNLPAVEKDLAAGSVVSLSQRHLRVRPLPLR
jgi:predicted nuclease of predicted toxin-antitoxin system